jgi:elongation factor P
MPIPATQMRVGSIILHEGKLHRVVFKQHVTPGNWRGMVQTKLQNVETGSTSEYRFRSTDTVEPARLENHELQYLYRSGDDFTFMNQENYEMINLSGEVLGDAAKYLQENMVIVAQYFQGKVIAIDVPMTAIYRITETDPAMKGATASGGAKLAVLENGIQIKVPQHLGVGDLVKIDTRDDSFIERANG